MADDVTYTVAANATPPGGTKATTDETSSGPHSVGSHMGIAKLAVSADGDSTHVPATEADGLLVEVSNPTAGGGLTDTELRATPVPVSGTVAVTGGLTDAQLRATPVPVTSLQEVLASANQTSVADNAADVQLLAVNAARKKFSITNDSTVTLYASYDGAASLTNYAVQIPPNSFFSDEDWVGEVRGIWASDPGTGAARITEFEA